MVARDADVVATAAVRAVPAAVAVAAGPVPVAVAVAVALVVAVAAIVEGRADALPQARQAPQAAPRPQGRGLARTGEGPVWRVRPEVDRVRLAHQPPDRGCSYRDDAQDQAWRQGVDQRLS